MAQLSFPLLIHIENQTIRWIFYDIFPSSIHRSSFSSYLSRCLRLVTPLAVRSFILVPFPLFTVLTFSPLCIWEHYTNPMILKIGWTLDARGTHIKVRVDGTSFDCSRGLRKKKSGRTVDSRCDIYYFFSSTPRTLLPPFILYVIVSPTANID